MKVYFIDLSKEAVPYQKEKHAKLAYKFLFWSKENVLLVGSRNLEMHKEVWKEAGLLAPERLPDGAGSILPPGEVCSWDSCGYDIYTPDQYKPLILEALGMKEMKLGLFF